MASDISGLVPPHGGGPLVQQRLAAVQAADAAAQLADAVSVQLSVAQLADVEMLASGAFTPLTGFMTAAERQQVLAGMRLPDGTLWPMPITLPVDAALVPKLRGQRHVALRDAARRLVAQLTLDEVYERDPLQEAQLAFGTQSPDHPGVAALVASGRFCAAGRVTALVDTVLPALAVPALTPHACRQVFAARGWRRVVGFQTRNPIHRAHEYILKCALETADGLLLHPLVGATKGDDIPADVRLTCYQALVQAALPAARTCLSVWPAAMRYAGPKEAVLHAIARQNYGCSHFIVGRDHAGVGSFYTPSAAQEIFNQLPAPLRIQPLFFDNAFFCRSCAQMATAKTCPHPPSAQISLSGTQVRQMLRRGERPPPEFSRPEVADILIKWART
jgi:sulfate adenylyltransferase